MFGVFATLRRLHPNTRIPDCLGACADTCGRPTERLDPWLPWLTDEDRKRELRGPRSRTRRRPRCSPGSLPPPAPLPRPHRRPLSPEVLAWFRPACPRVPAHLIRPSGARRAMARHPPPTRALPDLPSVLPSVPPAFRPCAAALSRLAAFLTGTESVAAPRCFRADVRRRAAGKPRQLRSSASMLRMRPRSLPRLALAGSRITARPSVPARSNCRGEPGMPPTGLPPAKTAPNLASPPLEAD